MKRISAVLVALALVLLWPSPECRSEPFYPVFRGNFETSECVIQEQRDEKYLGLLVVSVKISVSGAAGSGTICHYDRSTGWAYVISCGHLWSGNKDYDPSSKLAAKVETWYKGGSRMAAPATYDAEVMFWSNRRGYDVSLLRFKPNWNASYAPISSGPSPTKGLTLNSLGCDGGREVSRYAVVIDALDSADLTTKMNSPRPGRSGGGLLTDDCVLVGVCWGTSDISSGDGVGFFTPLEAIREMFIKNGHSWLLEVDMQVGRIPVFDHDNSSLKYDRHFVPLPKR